MELICKAMGCDLVRVNRNFCSRHTRKLHPIYKRYKRLESRVEEDEFGIYSRSVLLREYYFNKLKEEFRDEGHQLAIRRRRERIEELATVRTEVQESQESQESDEELVSEPEACPEPEPIYDDQAEDRLACQIKLRQAMDKLRDITANIITGIFRARLVGDNRWVMEFSDAYFKLLFPATIVWIYSGLQECIKSGRSTILGPDGTLGIKVCCMKKAATDLVRVPEWFEMVLDITTILAMYYIHQIPDVIRTVKLNSVRVGDKIEFKMLTPRIVHERAWTLDIGIVCTRPELFNVACPMCHEELELKLPYKSLGKHYVDLTYDIANNVWK